MYIRGLIAFLLVPVLSACVSSKTFDAKEAELAAAREEIKAVQAQAKNNLNEATMSLNEAMAARAKTEAELSDTRRDLDQCNKTTEAAKKYTETLKAREGSLREKLQTEVLAREVEISRLRDQLSVRVLDRILFKSGRADILPEGKKVLDKLVEVLATTDDMIRVEGHTDSVPIGRRLKQKYYSNWELAAARASSVVRYFESGRQIEPVRMEAVGFSKYHPVALGNSAADLKRNRRVEIVLSAPRMAETATGSAQPGQY